MEPSLSRRILKPPRRAERGASGFTLIEMLIVLAIIVIVTGIALSGQSGFNRTLALNNTAYDIGLTIRQAQSYGLSSQGFNSAAPGHTPPFGIAVSSSNLAQYVLFEDTYPAAAGSAPDSTPGDGIYENTNDSTIATYTLNNGFSFSDFCGYVVSGDTGTRTCASDAGAPLSALAVTFIRPNTVTKIIGRESGNVIFDDACFALSSDSGDSRDILVLQSGEVEVGNKDTIDPNNLYCP